VLNIDTYDYHRWHGTLPTIAFAFIAITFNTLFVRKLPTIEYFHVIMHIFGVLIFVPLWIMAPKREGNSPISEFTTKEDGRAVVWLL
jgi:hypothetical protein